MRDAFYESLNRIIVVTGHYGSGKTEFSVSLAMLLAGSRGKYEKLAIVDLDIVNPYFRSRERREELEKAGVSVYGSVFDSEVTAELPALGAKLRAPLEDETCRVIVDAGGNDSGAIVLNQFAKYFDRASVLTVINANRPDTRDLEGALGHIRAIESATGLRTTAVVNNCHLLRETTAADIVKGHALCKDVCNVTGRLTMLCDCYPQGIVNENELTELKSNLMPLGLYMRPTWLDR